VDVGNAAGGEGVKVGWGVEVDGFGIGVREDGSDGEQAYGPARSERVIMMHNVA
jgi:hypothetical protein